MYIGWIAMAVGTVLAVQSEAQCPAPSTPAVTFLAADAVTLGWTSFGNKPTNTFNVFLQVDMDPPNGLWVNLREQFLPAGSPLVATFTGLLPGARYRAAVTEYCTDYGGASASAYTNFVTAGPGNATGCAAPTAPSADALTSTSATLSWSSPNGDVGHAFRLVVQVDAAPSTGIWVGYREIDVAPGEPLVLTVDNLLPRALYRAAVYEFCDAGEGATASGFTSFQALGPNLGGTCDAPIVLMGKVMPTAVEVGWFSPNNDTNHAFEVVLQYDADPPNNLWVNYAEQFVPAGAPKNVTFSNLVVNAQYRTAIIEYCDGTNTGGAVASAFVNFKTVGPYLIVLQPLDAGRYDQAGTHNPADVSFLAGYTGAGQTNRNWFTFAVPQITNTITAAALRLPAYDVVSTGGVERYVLYSVTTTPAVVQAGGFGLQSVYEDLGSGVVLAERYIHVSESDTEIQVALNGDARILLEVATSSTIVLGGAMMSLEGIGGFGEYAFGSSASLANIQLLLFMNGYPPPDSDADGINDLDEEIAGTDPNSATSYLWINSVNALPPVNGTNALVLRWPSVSSRWYSLESTTNLVTGSYALIADGLPATPPYNVLTNHLPVGAPLELYRVKVTTQAP